MNKNKQNNNHLEKQKSKSYVLIAGISALICFGLAIAVFISMIIKHIWVFIIPVLFCVLLGLTFLASMRAVQKHGTKRIPRQVIFPTVRLWKDNGIDPDDMKFPPDRSSKRH
jgi:hypothetical protein